jgi:SNF2 family DNA or RNA helicase
MQIVDNTAIKFTLPTELVPSVVNNIAKSELVKTNGNLSEVLVYWGLEELTNLNRLVTFNKPLPSPIVRDYSWPGLYKPFDHQRTTAEFLSINMRAFCFNEAGTGKTSSVIWSADYLMTQKVIKKVLVICPLSIMYSAWQADVFKTAMHRRVAVAYGSAEKRKKIINGDYEFVIINYDGIGIVFDELDKAGFDLIVVDEANAYKNTSTKRWKALAKLMKAHTRLWMLTGTPASQSPVDAFGLAKLVSPQNIPRTMTVWRDKVMHQLTRFKWVPKSDAKTKVFAALQPAIRFTKSECLDLPEVMYQTREVPLSPQALRYYNALKKDMLIQAAGEQVTTVNAATNLNKLLQLSGGAVYTDDREVVEFDIAPRKNALLEVIEETEHKLIIFVPFTHTIQLVRKFLTEEGITNDMIDGSVSAIERSNIIRRFQETSEPRILVIQPQAASHGVTLTAANTVVFWSPVTSVETYLQCIARIDRYGQKNKMTVVHLQGSPVERRMYEVLQNKVDAHEKLVDLYKSELGIGENE